MAEEKDQGEIYVERKEEKLIEERKKKVVSFFKKTDFWVWGFLIVALILGIYIRSLPMTDHGGNPGLWDITTNTWTLGPDLDPFLFMRYAKMIVQDGGIPQRDMTRNVPIGVDTTTETQLLPYMIASTYWILHIFKSDVSVEFAAVIFPVIMFTFTIIVFFLFVREVFSREDKKSKRNSNFIAIISTFFMIVVPSFLARTIAGIPEKESAAFFFMFAAFYLFLKAWKAEKIKSAMIFGILSGIATALMGLIWGGVSYVFVTIAVASFIAFILSKIRKKDFLIYSLWLLVSWAVLLIFSNKLPLKALIVSLDTGLAFFVFFLTAVNFILWDTKISKIKILEKSKIPKNIISLIVAIILGVLIVSFVFGPSFIINKAKDINQVLFTPTTGRWGITVAENRQPYFNEWESSFGPFIKNVPILFWLFFVGSVVLFKKMLNSIKKKDSWILTFLYILFFFGLVFSRYSASGTFNGENSISKIFYYGSALLLIGSLIYYYIKYFKENNPGFQKIGYEFLFLFSLFALTLFTARSAVRLIMVLAVVSPIFLAYLIVISIEKFWQTKDETGRIFLGAVAILILILSVFVFWNFYQSVKEQAYYNVPSSYQHQWQKAMEWVRNETPKDSVFSHWWDYGYWLQSIGNRATVVDGGNVIGFWNYLIGRLVLTGDNQQDALNFLYSHNATHLLIDSTDIGKYTAYSSIGSDLYYDRYSWIPIMISDEKNIQELRNSTISVYQGTYGVDEDIVYNENGEEKFIPAQKAAIIAVSIEHTQQESSLSFKQPNAVFYNQGQQVQIPLRYVYYDSTFFDYKTGLEAVAYVIPRVQQTTQGGVSINTLGSVIYISPRVLRGLFAQIYLLDDPFNKFENFELVHNEPNRVVESLRAQGTEVDDFVYYQGVQGPIKIWKIKYNGNEQVKEEYLDKDSSKYISWGL